MTRKPMRTIIVVGVFLLCAWQAGEGDYQMLRWMAFMLSFALPTLILVWWSYSELQEKYDELRNKRNA